MANQRGPCFLAMEVAFLGAALMTLEVGASSLSGEGGLGWAAAWPACGGATGGCLESGEEAEEMAMDSESNRRILQDTTHLSYAALLRDSTPCKHPGSPYSNCRPNAVNPYTRPCADITGCGRHQVPATRLRD
ncbi:rapid alkalinization factor-like [Nymphaea colorata]|nr:rapid alkalinization factor-like [Nymphaea colorata]